MTVNWSGITSPAVKDWVGLYVVGSAQDTFTAWRWTTGAASGNVAFQIPANLPAGTYEVRLWANNAYTLLGTSNSFTVTK